MDAHNAAPSMDSLRTMMQMAAATASAAAGDASILTHHQHAPRSGRHHTSRSSHNRRQSISQLPSILGSAPFPKGAPLPSAADGARWRQIVAVATEISSKWVHPPESSQYETETLHHVRAILFMSKAFITQSFVSHVSGVSQGSLSHYVRGLFRGNQQNVEDRLSQFVRKFAAGELDTFLEEARAGARPLARSMLLDAAVAPVSAPSVAPSLPPAPPREPTPQQDTRPPVPPPPPPQLQPPPWQQRPLPPRPPLIPVQEAPRTPTDTPAKEKEKSTAMMTERAKRARQRQIMQIRRKSGITPFIKMLDDMQDPTPVIAVEKAFHALVAPSWETHPTHVEPLLLPIELYVEKEGKTLHMFTQWDLNERTLSPEVVTERIRRAKKLSKEFVEPAAMQIRRALFEAGMICPPPPNALDAENRRMIRIQVKLNEGGQMRVLRDEFEWDLGMGMINSPELFAQHLCADAAVSQRHAPIVARAIRDKLCCAHAIAYADEDTRQLALDSLADDDPLRNPLNSVTSALIQGPEKVRVARKALENEIEDTIVSPLLEDIVKEADVRKNERARKKKDDAERKELEILRAKEAAVAAERKTKLDAALKEVDDAAIELQAARGLDFRPYLAIQMGRGERPGVWTPGVFDRKRRRQTSFPMLQASRIQTNLIQPGPRSARRRKSSRRGEQMNEEKQRKNSGSDTPQNSAPPPPRPAKRELEVSEVKPKVSVPQTASPDKDMKIKLVLRIRAPDKQGGSSKKRRKR